MNLRDLKQACEANTGGDNLSLVLQRVPTGERIRLLPRGGPLGHVLCVEKQNRRTVAMFSKQAVLAWIRKQMENPIIYKQTERRTDAAETDV